jgi:hypothetical protein
MVKRKGSYFTSKVSVSVTRILKSPNFGEKIPKTVVEPKRPKYNHTLATEQ